MSASHRPVALLILSLILVLAGGCSVPSLLITPVSGDQSLNEHVVARGSTRRAKIAMIPVEGMLANTRAGTGGLLGAEENKVSLFKQQLDAAAADKRVKAVVLRINSPGGTVTASDTMYELVRDFRVRTGKPVVAACQDISASGGYLVALGADEIHATPTSVIGSIGVIFETVDLTGLLDKIGVRIAPLSSGPLKDMGSPFNGLSEEEREVMQAIIDELYGRFVAAVQANRIINDTETAFDGRVFTGMQAREIGLVDEVCQLPASLNRARQLIGENATVVMYRRPYGYSGSLYASAEPIQPGAGQTGGIEPMKELMGSLPLLPELQVIGQPGFFYLWMP